MVQGISNGLSENLCPFKELVPVRSIAGDVGLVNSAGTHKAPFVVIPSEPYLSDVFKTSVCGNFLRADVTMIV